MNQDKNTKESNDIQMDWILAEVKAIRNYCDSIEFEANKGKRENFISLTYIFEKTRKINDSVRGIEYRSELFERL